MLCFVKLNMIQYFTFLYILNNKISQWIAKAVLSSPSTYNHVLAVIIVVEVVAIVFVNITRRERER